MVEPRTMGTGFVAPLALPCSVHSAGSAAKRPLHHVTPPRFNRVDVKIPWRHKETLAVPRAATASASLVSILQLSAAVTLLYQAAFYFISSRFKTERLTDLAGTSNIALIALISLYLSGPLSMRHVLVPMAMVAWAVRLGMFLVRRIAVWKNDRRFDDIRGDPILLAQFWFLQGVWVWVTSLPATNLAAMPAKSFISSDLAALILFLLGFVLEAVADEQKATARIRKGWPETGLWRLSRHPNYFGEMCMWWGVYLAAAPALHGAGYVAVLSPVLVMLLLLFVSGVPMLEKSADENFGEDPEYCMYKRKTSVLIPFPPRLYEKLPLAVKRFLFLEFPIYDSITQKGA